MCEETAHVIVTCSMMIIFYLFFKKLLGIKQNYFNEILFKF